MCAVIQTKLAEYMPSFLISSHGEQPSKIVGFLKEVVDAYNFLAERYSEDVTRQSLSSALYDALFPEPFYRTLYNRGHEPRRSLSCQKNGHPATCQKFISDTSYLDTPRESLAF